jgi:hypothetical protein
LEDSKWESLTFLGQRDLVLPSLGKRTHKIDSEELKEELKEEEK